MNTQHTTDRQQQRVNQRGRNKKRTATAAIHWSADVYFCCVVCLCGSTIGELQVAKPNRQKQTTTNDERRTTNNERRTANGDDDTVHCHGIFNFSTSLSISNFQFSVFSVVSCVFQRTTVHICSYSRTCLFVFSSSFDLFLCIQYFNHNYIKSFLNTVQIDDFDVWDCLYDTSSLSVQYCNYI